MFTNTVDNGVVGMAHRPWPPHVFVATRRTAHTATAAHAVGAAAAIAAQRKRRANAAPTFASVDRSFI